MLVKKFFVLFTALLVLSGCATVNRQAYNKSAALEIKKIVIAEPSDDETVNTFMLVHPGTSFGLIGGLIAAADMKAKTDRVTSALNPQKTQLRHRFISDLSANLNKQGYETEIVQLEKGVEEKNVFSVLKDKVKGDALLVAYVQGSYIATNPMTPYAPYVAVHVKAEAANDHKVLYEDTISWGYTFENNTQTIHLAGGDTYRYENVSAIEGSADQAREALVNGVNAITTQVTEDLKKN